MRYTLHFSGNQARDLMYHLETARIASGSWGMYPAERGAEKLRDLVYKQFKEQQDAAKEKEKPMDPRFTLQSSTYMIRSSDFNRYMTEQFRELDKDNYFVEANEEGRLGETLRFAIETKDLTEGWVADRPAQLKEIFEDGDLTWSTRFLLEELVYMKKLPAAVYLVVVDG